MIIPACGFDSVPADMLYWFAMQNLKADFDNAHVTMATCVHMGDVHDKNGLNADFQRFCSLNTEASQPPHFIHSQYRSQAPKEESATGRFKLSCMRLPQGKVQTYLTSCEGEGSFFSTLLLFLQLLFLQPSSFQCTTRICISQV
jgi:hypothetical protein